MEPFEIDVNETKLKVCPNEDGTYTIYDGDHKIADLYPDIQDAGVVWESGDVITEQYLTIIGKAIEKYET